MRWTEIHRPEQDKLLCIVGPTASQKTELAMRLCEKWDGEIVTADSVQVYRHFDMGTGKPSEQERKRAVHHLVDIVEPHQPMDAARFAQLAQETIDDIRKRGKMPIVCGGSFLWVKALVWGLAPTPPANEQVRERLRKLAEEHGVEWLHDKLSQVDPETAARLGKRDMVRIERALEVYELTGEKLSELHRRHQQQGPRLDAVLVGIRWEPKELEQRIRRRAEGWLERGWIEEVQRLQRMGFGQTRPMGSVGYRQIREMLQGLLSREDLLEAITRATKIFARRQRTWLRDQPVVWIDPLGD